MMEKRKYNSLDVCKLLMAFCVVAIHTHPLKNCTIAIINNLYDSFVGMAVPFFFLSSGFLLAQKFDDSFASSQNSAATRKMLLKIVKMYLVWMAVYLPLAIYSFFASGAGVIKSIPLYFRNLIFVGEQYNSWHLWYLLSTIYALVFLLLVLRFKFSPKQVAVFSLFIFLISIGVDYLSAYTGSANAFVGLAIKVIRGSIGSGRILTGLFYLPLGCLLARKQPGATVSGLLFVGGYALNVFVQNSYGSSLFGAVSAIGLFCLVNSIELPNARMYPFARKMSTIIYLIHMYVWTAYYALVYGEKTDGLDSFLVTSAVCLIASAVTVVVMDRYHNRKLAAIRS